MHDQRPSPRGPASEQRRRVLAAGAIVASGLFTERAPGASRLANGQLQVGVIGVGNRGATNLAEIARHAKVVALGDVDANYLAPAADRYPDAKTFRDLRELLQQTELDAVVISTPDHTHAYAALTAMKRGLHVYCEKPLTHSIDELRKLVATAAEKKVITQTGMQHHVREGTRQAAAILKAGILGQVQSIHAWTDRPIWPQGLEAPAAAETPPKSLAWDLWLGPAEDTPYHSIYHPLRWRGWYRYGCGALGDFGPHLLDAVYAGLELTTPTRVSSQADRRFDKTFPAASVVQFDFAETRARPAFSLHWYDGGNLPAKKLIGVENPPPNGVMVIGEAGRLFIPDYGRAPRLLGFATQPKLPAPVKTPDDLYQDWAQACLTGTSTCLPFSASAPLMETCLLGNISLRLGEPIVVDTAKHKLEPEAARAYLSDKYRKGWELP